MELSPGLREITFFFLIGVACGLKCWTCENARSNVECNRVGYLKNCLQDEVFCQNEFRRIEGLGTQVNKRCKQAKACSNNQLQNAAGFSPLQCDGKDENFVCRCCCKTNNCNAPLVGCGRVATCEKPPNPRNGRIICPGRIRFGTTCRIKCNTHFRPNRNPAIKCTGEPRTNKPGKFPKKIPRCVRKPPRCYPLITKIERGSVTCTNPPKYDSRQEKNFDGSKCVFRCNRNSFLFGHQALTCGEAHWDHAPPICRRGSCDIPPGDVNTVLKCTQGYKFGSKCTFTCRKGFKITGRRISVCTQSAAGSRHGSWSNGVPRCRRVTCPMITSPNNAVMGCTNGSAEHSVCTFLCSAGYDMDKTTSTSAAIKCVDDGNGVGGWNASVSTCSEVACRPRFQQPRGGNVVCTKSNKWGSVCKFKCNRGYDLDGTLTKTLRRTCSLAKKGVNRGVWSGPAATCSPVRCRLARRAPKNGYMTCTKGNYAGSICAFRCKTGYDLDNTTDRLYTIRCIDMRYGIARGEWDNIAPTCNTRVRCKIPHTTVKNGKVTCSDGDFLGSECRFVCNQGYRLDGEEYTNCVDLLEDGDEVAEWTNSPPRCRPKPCAAQWYDKRTVKKTCSGMHGGSDASYLLGSECHYTCRHPGFYPINPSSEVIASGKVISTCTEESVWSKFAPRCLVKTCAYLETPQNGYETICTDGYNFKSKCSFECKYGYKLSHELPLICVHAKRTSALGKWNRPKPLCIAK